jgi:hypothetical protein
MAAMAQMYNTSTTTDTNKSITFPVVKVEKTKAESSTIPSQEVIAHLQSNLPRNSSVENFW